MLVRTPRLTRLLCFLVVGISIVVATSDSLCFGQDKPQGPDAPKVDLLALSGSKPALTPAGEGITSIKISDLFKIGITQVKPFDSSFKIELPVGYTLFNNLAYMIDSEAVFSGPNDFVFRIPSAVTKESFDKLRILVADYDDAEPQKPRWIDVTLMPGASDYWKDYLTKGEFEKRLPDFGTHSLHGFMWERSRVLVVALKDSSVARDSFVADLSLTVSAPEQIMEGRKITYELTVTNNGPDAATDVSLHADPTFDLKSVTSSQGKCRMAASNVYCKFSRLEKGKSISVKIVEQCPWGAYFQREYEPRETPPQAKSVRVSAAEGDPNYESNNVIFLTRITADPNKAPVAEITSPKRDELIAGPNATVNIIAKASDPDGFVNKIEFFDDGVSIGKGTLKSADEYELIYNKVPYGRHRLEVKVTDNLGREAQAGPFEFFVNGFANVEITGPKAGSLLSRSDGEIPVTIHVSHTDLGIKKATVNLTAMGAGLTEQEALPVGNDVYTARIDCSFCKRDIQLMATVIDTSGIETRSEPVSFKITKPPEVTLYQYDGEDLHRITEETPAKPSSELNLVAEVEHDLFADLNIVKIDFFANGKLIETYTQDGPNHNGNRYIQWELKTLPPGRYKVQAVATDSDGSIGKSAVVEIVITPR